MTLDIVVPTWNRRGLLRKALESIARARFPAGLAVTVIVVDNNSTDGTADEVAAVAQTFPVPLRYVREPRQGSSSTRNAGIAAGRGNLIGFIDDDEEIERDWLAVVEREFADPALDFIGGPYLANWVTPVPDWLPPAYPAAIGVIPPKPRSSFDAGFTGNLMGGNAVLRRRVFERVGGYEPKLGRGSKGLLSDEDAEMLRRIRAAGLHGLYVPDLAIRHYIAPERLTRGYHRRWVYWRAASQGMVDRTSPDRSLAYLFGVQRYRVAQAAKGLLKAPLLRMRGRKAEAFSSELRAWDLFGFVYGKFWMDIEAMYRP